MPVSFKIVFLAAIVAIATSAVAADRPDSGSLLREITPPPTLRQQQQLPMIEPQQPQKEVETSGVRVKVSGFTFTGNTVFSGEELTALMSGYIGKELTLVELNGAAATITNAYRAKGYFLASATIPPQTIKTGAPIIITIVEGILEGVRLETKPVVTRTPYSLLQRYIDRIPTGKPAEEESLSDMVMRINEIPGISSRILLEPGSQPGTTKALLEVMEGKPYSISLDSDNYGNYSTGYYRIGSTLELYSPLQMGDLFTLRAQTAFSGDTQTVQTGYSLPITGSGTKLGLNYSFVTYQLGESFKSLDASGNAHNFTLSITQPLLRSRKIILNLSLAGEGKLLDDRTGSAGLKNQRHTTSGQAGVSGVEMDTLLGGGSTAFSLNYTGGFVGIDDATTLATDQSASGLHTNGGYHKLAMSLSRNQSLYKALSFYTGVSGQWASTNLDSAEQFSLGGTNAVRAFPVSEGSGDMGFVGTAELRYLIDKMRPLPGSVQLAAFVDHGYAVIHDTPLAPDNTRNLTGVGLGATWFADGGFNIRSSVAWRTAGAATTGNDVNFLLGANVQLGSVAQALKTVTTEAVADEPVKTAAVVPPPVPVKSVVIPEQKTPAPTAVVQPPAVVAPAAILTASAPPATKAAPTKSAGRYCNKTTVVIIEFGGSSFEVKGKYATRLDQLGRFLKENPTAKGTIEGHTASGTAAGMTKLSQARADSVRDYLVMASGIDGSRLSAVGYGESRPIASNKTAAGRRKNFRVEAVIVCE